MIDIIILLTVDNRNFYRRQSFIWLINTESRNDIAWWNMLGVPYPVFTRAPLVGSLDMDYWCSAYGTKGARVNTGYGTQNMFWHLKDKNWENIFLNFCEIRRGKLLVFEAVE